jgi:hypothetical protein
MTLKDPAGFKKSVLDWLELLRIGSDYGRYRVCAGGGDSLGTSCAALFIRDLLGDTAKLSAGEREQWASFIRQHQDPSSGYFFDEVIKQTRTDPYWGEGYIVQQSTTFALMALWVLGSMPEHPLNFVEELRDRRSLIKVLEALDWREPWYQSNEVMYRVYFLLDDYERTGNKDSLACAHAVLDWLDSWQDPATGLWATDRGASKYHGVFTTFHFLFFYFYLHRPVHHMEKLIDSCLVIQNRRDGLFSPHGGGAACPDLDAVDILVKCGAASGHRTAETAQALERSFYGVLRLQQEDGGFCSAERLPFTPLEWLRSLPNMINTVSRSRGLYSEILGLVMTHLKPQGYLIKYTGRDDLAYHSARSDVYSTWFRLLVLALIDVSYPGKYFGIPWNIQEKVGPGWHAC